MSRNTKHKDYKRYLALVEKEHVLRTQIKNLGYKTLDKPIHHGYNAYLTLREDVAKRDDKMSWLYQYFIDTFAYEVWSRTKDFKIKRKKKIEIIKPCFRRITEKEYNGYLPWVQEHIQKRTEFHWGVEYHYYVCVIPAYCLVTKIKNSYITSVKIIDGNLESELQLVRDELQPLYNLFSKSRSGGYKFFQKEFNQRDRGYNKMVLNKNLKTINPFEDIDDDGWLDTDWKDWVSTTGHNDIEYPLRYKPRNSARWYWW